MLHDLINWLVAAIGSMGYTGILLLMAMESSVIPIPSEIALPPAGYLVQQGKMNMALVILSGTSASLVGAYANYFAARYLGRRLLLRYGRYVWITEEHFARVEQFFRDHGEISTFVGRLLPVARHLVSLPAGLASMNHWKFSLYTLAGGALWVSVLTLLGYFIGANEALIERYSRDAVVDILVFSVLLIAVDVMMQRRARSRA